MPSSSRFLTVRGTPTSSEVNWNVRAFSPSDNFVTPLCVVNDYSELSGTVSLCDVGAGSITMDMSSPTFSNTLTNGDPGLSLLTPGLLWRAYDGYVPRFEWIAERFSAVELADDGASRAVVISGRGSAATLERAKVLPPGFPSDTSKFWTFKDQSRMRSWVTLLAEAKARGTCGYINRTFNADVDSEGRPWLDIPTRTQRVPDWTPDLGDDMLRLLNVATGNDIDDGGTLFVEWVMRPGFKLHVATKIGSDKSKSIIFRDGKSTLGRQVESDSTDVSNYIVVRDAYGKTALARAKDSVDKIGQVEYLEQYSDVVTDKRRSSLASSILRAKKDEKSSITVRVRPDASGSTVFRDFNVGDWIGVDEFNYSTGASQIVDYRVVAISVLKSEAFECELTLRSRIDQRIRDVERRTDKAKLPDTKMPSIPEDYDLNPGAGYALTPVDGRWGVSPIGDMFGRAPCVYQEDEPTLEECPVGYFWLRRNP